MEKHSSRRITKTDDAPGDVVDSSSTEIGLLSGGGKGSEVWGLLNNNSSASARSSSSQPSESIWSSDKPDSAWKSSGAGMSMLHQNGGQEPWSGSSAGWGGRKSGSGWGSPGASPTPNTGTEGWGMTPPVQQTWSQETRPDSGWERLEDKFSSGWKKMQGASENSGESKTDPGANVWSHLQTKSTGDSAWTAAQSEEKPGSQWGGPGIPRGNTGSQSGWENGFPPGSSTPQTASKSWGWAGPSPTAAGAEQPQPPLPPQHQTTSSAVTLPAPSTWAQAAGRGLNISNSSKPTEGAPATPSTPGSSASLTKEDLIAQLVNSKDGWGKTPIRQDTTWDLEEGASSSSPASFAASSSRKMSSSSSAVAVGGAPASSSVPTESASSHTNACLANTGTAIWESSRDNASVAAAPPPGKSPSMAPIGSKDLGAKDRTNISGKPPMGGTAGNSWGSQPGEFPDNGLLVPAGGGQLPSLDLSCDKSPSGGVWNMSESTSGSARSTSAAPETPWNPRGGKDTAVWESNRAPSSWSDSAKLGLSSSSSDAPVLRHDSSSGGWNLEKEAASGLRDSTNQRNDGSVFDGGSRSSHDQTQSWRAPGSSSSSSSSSSLASQATSLSHGRSKPNDAGKDGGGIWQPHLSPAAASEWTTTTSDQADAGLSLWNPTSMTKPNTGWGEGPWSTKLKTPSSSAWNDGSEMYSAADDRKLSGFESSSKSVQPSKTSLLQQLIDLGFHKEDVQAALHSNNMNIEQATSELLSNDNRKSADHDPSSSVSNGQKCHGGQGMPGSTDLSSLSIPDGSSSSFGHPGGILNHLVSTESQAHPPNNSLPRTSLQTPSSLVANLARSVTPNLQPQQFASGLNTQGPVVPPPLSSQLSGRQPQQQQQQVMQNQMLQQLKMAMQSGLMSHQPPNPIPSPALLLGLRQLVQLQNVLDWLLIQHQVLVQQNRNIGLVQPGQVEQLLVNIQNVKQQIVQQKWKIGQLQKQAAPSTVPPWPPVVDQYKDFPKDFQAKDEPFNPWRVAPPPTHAPPPPAALPMLDGLGSMPPSSVVDLGSKSHSGLPMNPPYLSDGAWSVPPWPSHSSSGATVTTSSLSDAGSAGGAVDSKISGDADGGKGASGAAAELVSSSTATSDAKQPNPSGAVLDIEEFIPGKPWQGGKSADDDPSYVNMSRGGGGGGFNVSSIMEPQHILNALGRSNSTSDSHWLATSLGLTGSSGASQNHLREAAAWASGGPSANQMDHQPWGQAKNTRPPPGLQQSSFGRSVSWTPGTGNRGDAWLPGSASNSLVLKNFPNQIDSTIVKALCQQHGPLQLFRYNPASRQVLVSYRNKEDAIQARLALHSCVLANTPLIAEFVPDAEAARMLDQLDAVMQGGAGAWPQTRGTGPMKKTVDAASYWNGASSSFWEGYGGIWGPAAAAAGAEEHRHGDLLGSQ